MSTRSVIGITDRDGNGQLIYCHFDGYPDGAGLILLQHWQNESKVRELMALGDLSSLGHVIGVKVDFDDYRRTNGEVAQCLAYGRDRGESNIEAASFSGGGLGFVECARLRNTDVEYGYLWTPDGWFGTTMPSAPQLQSLGSMVKASLCETNQRRIENGHEPIPMPEELANVS